MTLAQHTYNQLLETGEQLVHAARHSDWQAVSALEALIKQRWFHLRIHESQHDLTKEERQKKHAALLALLRYDAQVRALAEPGWNKLSEALGSQVSDVSTDS